MIIGYRSFVETQHQITRYMIGYAGNRSELILASKVRTSLASTGFQIQKKTSVDASWCSYGAKAGLAFNRQCIVFI
ncbi:hypothetical protein D0Z62_11175 [Providencia rettgeri]|nr:hypothetical protein D0Z62_11175 [Providencia rettgeri]